MVIEDTPSGALFSDENYLISQDVNNEYDTFDSAVVVAADENEARKICPDDNCTWVDGKGWYNSVYKVIEVRPKYFAWATDIKDVKVEYIGIAQDSLEIGKVVCASFNAG